MRGQVAVEYLIIVGLVLMFLLPIWSYTTTVQQVSNEQLALAYADTTVNRIVDAVNIVAGQGPPARINVMVQIPNGVISTNLSGKTAQIRVRVGTGSTDVVAVANVNMTGIIPLESGTYTLQIDALMNGANITVVE
ncbi:MAG: hypothetical protein KKA90_02095 [Nanoarchaeota archaeon]|nr:hypothetical protein [Nanoarchaeota archaeon]